LTAVPDQLDSRLADQISTLFSTEEPQPDPTQSNCVLAGRVVAGILPAMKGLLLAKTSYQPRAASQGRQWGGSDLSSLLCC